VYFFVDVVVVRLVVTNRLDSIDLVHTVPPTRLSAGITSIKSQNAHSRRVRYLLSTCSHRGNPNSWCASLHSS